MGKVPGQMEGAARDQGCAEGNHDDPSDKLLDSHAIFALQVFANQKENWNINILMVFTVTSSDCKVKKARFYEFFFTLG